MNVVVTGASKGIGYSLVKEFVKCKASKIFAISRNEALLRKLKQECEAIGNSEIIIIPRDLTKMEFGEMQNYFSGTTIDILINNAGLLINKPFENINYIELQKMYDTNVFVPFLFTQFLLPNLKQAKHAHIVNIGSMGGVQGSLKFPGLSAYSSSKSALSGLTECMAEELKEFNIKANCLALGAVNTEMLSQAFPQYKAPLNADDISEFIAKFAISDGRFMNGKIIPLSISNP